MVHKPDAHPAFRVVARGVANWEKRSMKKLIQGIIDFRKNRLSEYKETFAKLSLGQSPDALLIACSDSRVVPNLFASTNPGDLFVVRNVGNLIPPCDKKGLSTADESEAAAIEFAVDTLQVKDIIVCGHSECGAMQGIAKGRESLDSPNLKSWLRHADVSLSRNATDFLHEMPKEDHNRLSQLNVLLQLDHLKTYPSIQRRLESRKLRLHAWWFELKTASVYVYDTGSKRFVLIDESVGKRLMQES